MKHLLGLAAAAALASFVTAAHANTVDGSVYFVSDAVAGNAIPANVPATPADLTFSVNSPFTFTNAGDSKVDTIGAFLTSSGATCLTGCANLTHVQNDTLWNFTGFVTVTNGESFTVTHDDGLTLSIGGNLVINQPGPTSPVTQTFTYGGPDGTFAFQLVYGECCGGPAELQISLPLESAVPEPSTWAMMIVGFAGLGYMGFRQSRRRMIATA